MPPDRGSDVVGNGGDQVVAPAGTPSEIVARMNKEINLLLADPGIAENMLVSGPMAAPGSSPHQFAPFLRSEHQRLALVSREIGLLPE